MNEEEGRRNQEGVKTQIEGEEPKARESSLGDVIIQDENEGGRETARDEGLCRVPVRRGRDRYESKHGPTLCTCSCKGGTTFQCTGKMEG